jgi:hypothetical protein
MDLFRAMKIDPDDGLPRVGIRRSMLGVRPTDPANTVAGRKFDVPAVADDDPVTPGMFKGLSVNLDPKRLRKDSDAAVWSIDSAVLSRFGLGVEPDPVDPHHMVIAPLQVMTLKQYQDALCLTRPHWNRV